MHVGLHLVDIALYLVKSTGGKRVADLEVHLRRKVDLAGYLRYAAVLVTGLREIIGTLKPDTLPHMKLELAPLNLYIVRRGLETGHIDTVPAIVLMHGIKVFGLGKRVILIRHTHVPWYVTVSRLGNKHTARQLSGAGKLGDYLELPGITVKIDFKIVGAVVIASQSGKLATLLECHTFYQCAEVIIIGIERQIIVYEIIYREFVAVIIGAFFAAYAAYRSGIAREYACKGVLLVMMDNAILVGVDIHILRSSGQLQPTVTVFRRIYVFRRSCGEQARIDLCVVCHIGLYLRQTVPVAESDAFPMFTTAQVDGGALYPVFSAGCISHRLEPLVAIFAVVVHNDIVAGFNGTDLPVIGPETGIDGFHDEHHMLPGRGCQREHRLIAPVCGVEDKEPGDQVLQPVELQRVLPLDCGFLYRTVFLGQPVAPPHEVRIIVHLKRHALRQGEGNIQDIARLYPLRLCAVVPRFHRELQPAVA